ncbi:hypothetical protein IW262DRAFT_1462010 [Armillaria fumosa]|nr:hypothetical protein IW262DRAFT_1462010 [Armillaria fumosa]
MVTKTPESIPETLTVTQLAQIIQALKQLGLIMGPTNTSSGSTSANPLGDSDNVLTSQEGNGGPPGAGCVAVMTAYHHDHMVKKESTSTMLSKSLNTQILLVQGTPLGGGQHLPTPGAMFSPQIHRSTTAWYTVTVGYEVGIFQGWDHVVLLILHVSGLVYLHHPSCVAAQAHYNNTLQHGDVKIVLCDDSDDE